MIISKVIRDKAHRRHITRADYGDDRPILGVENVLLPKIRLNSPNLEARALNMALEGLTLTHRHFDAESRSYRLSRYIEILRYKGWPFVDHDQVQRTNDKVPRSAKFTRYELFADFTPKLKEKIRAFQKALAEVVAKQMQEAA
jgi:hypothetical protein